MTAVINNYNLIKLKNLSTYHANSDSGNTKFIFTDHINNDYEYDLIVLSPVYTICF